MRIHLVEKKKQLASIGLAPIPAKKWLQKIKLKMNQISPDIDLKRQVATGEAFFPCKKKLKVGDIDNWPNLGCRFSLRSWECTRRSEWMNCPIWVFEDSQKSITAVWDPHLLLETKYRSLKLGVIFKNLPWGLSLLQVDGENWFICKKSHTVS